MEHRPTDSNSIASTIWFRKNSQERKRDGVRTTMKFNTLILAILMLSGVVLPMMPEVHPQIPRNEGDEPLEFKSTPTTGSNTTNWQSDTTFTTDEIKVAENVGGGFNINIDQGTWWYGQKLENTTWISMRQTDWLTGDYVYLECKNNDNNQIKCWLRGTVSGEYNFWIELTGGAWNEDTFRYETPEFSMDYTDVYEFGFPMIWDEENSRLGIKVSGTFDIDPLISEIPDGVLDENNYKQHVVQADHFEYIFYHSGSYFRYIYRNTTTAENGDASWINSTKAWAVNKTYATTYPYVQGGVNAAYPIAFDTNGTHVYGFVNTPADGSDKCGREATASRIGCFLLFNITRQGDKNNVTDGYNAGQLVIHSNASIPCLGNAGVGSSCGNWADEMGNCTTGTGNSYCSVAVSMNSSGNPMVAWASRRSFGQQNGIFAPSIMIAVAENPAGATCFDSTAGTTHACTETEARNGAEGTWTTVGQVDSRYKVVGANSTHAAGSGNRYIWSPRATMGTTNGLGAATHGHSTTDIDMCSMGSGNMLFVKKNRTGSDSNQIWGRMWYQSNATWGSAFSIVQDTASKDNRDRDDIDLVCTPNSAGVMTAHLAWGIQDTAIGGSNGGNQPRVYYKNFTGPNIQPVTEGDTIAKWYTDGVQPDEDNNRVITDLQIVADNSTGVIGIYYLDTTGGVYFNTTGTFGTQGFIDTGQLEYHVQPSNTNPATGYGDRTTWIMSAPKYYNGTGIATEVHMIIGTNQNNTYVDYYNSTMMVESKFIFYGQAGQAMVVSNMTFYSYRNATLLTSSTECSTCNVLIQPGWYLIDNIYRGNSNANINITEAGSLQTRFYVGNGYNTSNGFIVGNVTITINFYRELLDDGGNVSPWPDPNCGGKCPAEYMVGDGTDNEYKIRASIWFGNQKVEKEFDGFGTRTDQTVADKRTFFVDTEPTMIQFRYDARGDADYNASRWLMPTAKCPTNEGCSIPLTMTLSDFNSNRCGSDECPHYIYAFDLVDPTITSFIGGTFIVKKQTTNGIILITEQPIPADMQVETTLFYREEYLLSVMNAEKTKETSIGTFLAEDDVTTSVIIQDISFSPEIIVQHKYIRWDVVHNRTAGTVRLWFADVNNQTSNVNLIIWNMSGIQYNATQTAQTFSVTWPGASSNVTQQYWAKIVVSHNDFGQIVESKPVRSYGSPANFIDFGFCPTCSDRLIPTDSPWFVYIGGFATIFVAGLFSTASAVAGTLILATWVGIMYQFGFFPGMESIMMVFILLFAVITVFAISRRDW